MKYWLWILTFVVTLGSCKEIIPPPAPAGSDDPAFNRLNSAGFGVSGPGSDDPGRAKWFWLIVILVLTVTILSLPIYNCHMGWVDYHCHSFWEPLHEH